MQNSGGPFSNAARNLRQLGKSPAAWSWVGLILFMQWVIELSGDPQISSTGWRHLVLSREGFLAGKFWEVISYGLLHGGWWHAGLNSLFILLVGSRVEYVLGPRALSKVMILGIVVGGAFHLMLGSGRLVGASGGCFALVLLMTSLSPESRMLPYLVSARSLGLGILLAELALTLLNPGLGLPGFSAVGDALVKRGMESWFVLGHACHLGGGMAGWAYGRWLLRPRVTLARLRRDRARRETGRV